jgi:hypothetical protein
MFPAAGWDLLRERNALPASAPSIRIICRMAADSSPMAHGGVRLQLLELFSELPQAPNCTRIFCGEILVTRFQEEGINMKYFLDSIGWTVIWGVVLTIILYNIVKHALQ